MNKQKILTPNFSANGWNIEKIKAKNDKGLCGFKRCRRRLAKEPSYFVAGKICDKCSNELEKKLEEYLIEKEQRFWRNFIKVAGIK